MAEAYRPEMSAEGLAPTHDVTAIDEFGKQRDMQVAGEFPLTIKVDDCEVVTLMTLGCHPEALTLGYLRNQRMLEQLEDVQSVQVDWGREQVNVRTVHGRGIADLEARLRKKTITTGCGQGTMFSCTLNDIYDLKVPEIHLRQSTLYTLLTNISNHNEIYRRAGAVHGCALCDESKILSFIEDVGRHNAADAISGYMWLERIPGADKIFYTTGRLTSEIVMKAALMGIPALLSRSGVTHMGLELARDLGLVMIARAKGKHFLVYSGAEQLEFDQIPPPKPSSARDRATSLI